MKHKIYYFKVILVVFTLITFSLFCAACVQDAKLPKIFTIEYIAADGGIIVGEAEQQVEKGADCSSVIAQPDEGYEFDKWSDGITTAARQDTDVRSDFTVTAIFKKKTYTVRYETDGNGILQGAASQTVEHGGNASFVKAIPNTGYEFVKWSDDVTSATRLDTEIRNDFTVIATFKKKTYTVRYETDGNGVLQGKVNQTVEHGGNASTVTAIPNEGYEFVKWSDGIITATRQDKNIRGNSTVTATFKKKIYTIRYETDGNGTIQGEANQTVEHGESAASVTAIPNEGYKFVEWSDGSTDPERHDTNIRSPLTVTAYFSDYIEYKVYGDVGGTISGNAYQKAWSYTDFESVTAIPAEGYIFMGWSDGLMSPERRDNYALHDKEYYAYFEPVEKTFRYDYGIASGMPTVAEITINRYQIQNAKFMIPQIAGYTFCGWYADKDYQMKVADASGRLFTGYYTFLLETDTLYAKWQKQGEEIATFKILMPVVDEVHAMLYSTWEQKDIVVDYKMSYMEKKIYILIVQKFSEYLNEWFAGKVIFEADAYFTTQPFGSTGNRVGQDSFGPTLSDERSYSLRPEEITEIKDILRDYHGAISSDNLNDPKGALRYYAGQATMQTGSVCFDQMLAAIGARAGTNQYIYIYEWLLSGLSLDRALVTYLHEFAHTIEMRFSRAYFQLYGYHNIVRDYIMKHYENYEIVAVRLYLLNQAVSADGQIVGIPPKFWETPALWGESLIRNL